VASARLYVFLAASNQPRIVFLSLFEGYRRILFAIIGPFVSLAFLAVLPFPVDLAGENVDDGKEIGGEFTFGTAT